ncbi:acylphosphatase [Lacimicrobium alkaliphilum]|uniref:Acylphosphatase n=1 Tax=Lacimicrobium alkaliphilum TaxID=1526571 RepID=A0A0U3B4F3_9ALTE|nr:acylphosphatase [Lacimicrobium alkaliphilum]ALS98425.1 acylphosphatase [Lacimicrobium alkaliphilum]
MTQQCIKVRVTGKVQGVFFRRSTQQQAQQLGLNGYAKNLSDGSVEVLACGESSALAKLEAFLHQGPPDSEVEHVEVQAVADAQPDGFRVL